MKLGEALTLRRRQADKLNDLRSRINTNVLIQEGDKPQEEPDELIKQFVDLSEAHADLVKLVNNTNHKTVVDGRTIAQMLVEKEHLSRVRNMITHAANSASPSRADWRFGRQEIKFVPVVDVPTLRSREEELSHQIDALDLRIQEVNWQTDLVEWQQTDFVAG